MADAGDLFPDVNNNRAFINPKVNGGGHAPSIFTNLVTEFESQLSTNNNTIKVKLKLTSEIEELQVASILILRHCTTK